MVRNQSASTEAKRCLKCGKLKRLKTAAVTVLTEQDVIRRFKAVAAANPRNNQGSSKDRDEILCRAMRRKYQTSLAGKEVVPYQPRERHSQPTQDIVIAPTLMKSEPSRVERASNQDRSADSRSAHKNSRRNRRSTSVASRRDRKRSTSVASRRDRKRSTSVASRRDRKRSTSVASRRNKRRSTSVASRRNKRSTSVASRRNKRRSTSVASRRNRRSTSVASRRNRRSKSVASSRNRRRRSTSVASRRNRRRSTSVASSYTTVSENYSLSSRESHRRDRRRRSRRRSMSSSSSYSSFSSTGSRTQTSDYSVTSASGEELNGRVRDRHRRYKSISRSRSPRRTRHHNYKSISRSPRRSHYSSSRRSYVSHTSSVEERPYRRRSRCSKVRPPQEKMGRVRRLTHKLVGMFRRHHDDTDASTSPKDTRRYKEDRNAKDRLSVQKTHQSKEKHLQRTEKAKNNRPRRQHRDFKTLVKGAFGHVRGSKNSKPSSDGIRRLERAVTGKGKVAAKKSKLFRRSGLPGNKVKAPLKLGLDNKHSKDRQKNKK